MQHLASSISFMEQVQFYISVTSVLDCLDHSNNTYKFLKWLAFPFDVKWSAVCLPEVSEQDHWHNSCWTIYLKESLSLNVQTPFALVHDTAAVNMEWKVLMSFKSTYRAPLRLYLLKHPITTTHLNCCLYFSYLIFLSYFLSLKLWNGPFSELAHLQPSHSTAAVK